MDHALKCGLQRGFSRRHQAVAVLPRGTMKAMKTNLEKGVFGISETSPSIAQVSSSRVREALASNSYKLVLEMVGEPVLSYFVENSLFGCEKAVMKTLGLTGRFDKNLKSLQQQPAVATTGEAEEKTSARKGSGCTLGCKSSTLLKFKVFISATMLAREWKVGTLKKPELKPPHD
mmetsp:Transcript_7576/g.10739  ORF Transcript_7576/g.10739 Transcript_7576/m.10739 type:complete len:175 (+) Transcript_7576:551-1075(+)